MMTGCGQEHVNGGIMSKPNSKYAYCVRIDKTLNEALIYQAKLRDRSVAYVVCDILRKHFKIGPKGRDEK